VGDIPSGSFSFTKRNFVGWLSGSLIALADSLCDLGKLFWLKASIIAEGSRARFELYNGICFPTEEKHGEPQSG
jgi:hypothetical protein